MSQNDNFFWEKVYLATGVTIKPHIKNIFQILSQDNALSFGSMTQEDIAMAEKFVREEMKDFLDDDLDPKEYYGIHQKNPTSFKFMDGDKMLLVKLIEIMKTKEIEFWTPNSTESSTKSLANPQQRPPVYGKPANFSIKDEEIKLKRSISVNITNFKKKKARFLDEQSEELLDGKTDITMSAAYEDESQETIEYTANVKCPLCVQEVSLKKVEKAGKSAKWTCSNFGRHLQVHLNLKKDFSSVTTERHSERHKVYDFTLVIINYIFNYVIKLKKIVVKYLLYK